MRTRIATSIALLVTYVMYLPGSTQREVLRLIELQRQNSGLPASAYDLQSIAGFLAAVLLVLQTVLSAYQGRVHRRQLKQEQETAKRLLDQTLVEVATNRNTLREVYVHQIVQNIIERAIRAELELRLERYLGKIRTFNRKLAGPLKKVQTKYILIENARRNQNLQDISAYYDTKLREKELQIKHALHMARREILQFQSEVEKLTLEFESHMTSVILVLRTILPRFHGQPDEAILQNLIVELEKYRKQFAQTMMRDG